MVHSSALLSFLEKVGIVLLIATVVLLACFNRGRAWVRRRFKELDLIEEYFPRLFTRWQAAIWGGSVLAVAFSWHFITSDWPPYVKLSVCVVALFFAGYYVWRVDHVRLIPKFAVTSFTTERVDTFDKSTHLKNGTSVYFQLEPKCLTEANVEECRGLLTSIEMWDDFTQNWQVKEGEVFSLRWSFDEGKEAEPITLSSGGERRLNVFYVHNSNAEIRPCVWPFPGRFWQTFNQLPLRQVKRVRFNIQVEGKDCPKVKLALIVSLTENPFKPTIELEQIATKK